MLELVNLSNCRTDVELINNSAACLQKFLYRNNLDGIEMMFCAPWDEQLHKKEWIYGSHLRFWPCWLDFWRGRRNELLLQFGNKENIKAYYGGLTKDAWLAAYRGDIRAAKQAGADYIVFHVSHARTAELFSWRFSATDREVIEATVEVVNELADEIPSDMALLFENLWWPGLSLRDKELTARLLENVNHSNTGIMLDIGHLMNTNPQLETETAGVDYVLETLARLGECRRYIRGIHLHRSLTGRYIDAYIKDSGAAVRQDYTAAEVIDHVLKMDEHLPFSTPAVWRIIDYVRPDYLVHEFVQTSLDDWEQKIVQQRQALRRGRTYR